MIAYITGASSGIGKALAENLLNSNHKVIGIARKQTIHHPNYTHVNIDLSDLEKVKSFKFTQEDGEDIVLVNNAGSIGPIKPVGDLLPEDIIQLNHLNITAPQILCNQFMQQYKSNKKNKFQIINISSGAGKRPIDAWANYCASKAAIDLFTQTIDAELKARDKNNWNVFAVAPGVVDTPMQKSIRNADPKDFLNRQHFVDLKSENHLVTPSEVALKLMNIIQHPNQFEQTLVSLKTQ